MNGHQYEHQCAKRLKSKGFYNVTVTKGSGDQGIRNMARKLKITENEKYTL